LDCSFRPLAVVRPSPPTAASRVIAFRCIMQYMHSLHFARDCISLHYAFDAGLLPSPSPPSSPYNLSLSFLFLPPLLPLPPTCPLPLPLLERCTGSSRECIPRGILHNAENAYAAEMQLPLECRKCRCSLECTIMRSNAMICVICNICKNAKNVHGQKPHAFLGKNHNTPEGCATSVSGEILLWRAALTGSLPLGHEGRYYIHKHSVFCVHPFCM